MSAAPYGAMAELAASLHGVVTRTQAAALGLTTHDLAVALKDGWLREAVPGLLVVTAYPRTWMQDLRVATCAAASEPIVSHRAAARLHRFDGFASDVVEISVERPRRYRRQPPVDLLVHHVSSLPRCDLVLVDSIATTGVARTLSDLGSVVSDELVWRALISARRRHDLNPLWLRQTAMRLHRPGQHGTSAILRALDRWATAGRLPDTWFEELVATMLTRSDIPHLLRQFEVRGPDGRFIARVDLAIPRARLAIEAHSREFHFGPEREAADEDRDLRLAAVGWEVLYLGWYSQRRPAEVADLVATVCRRRLAEV